ncbi:glycosyl transferase group 1 protein [Acidovorax sp. KKS102]|uniref:glycosyltransferase n=1 Tax=Acidovorax sp. KKS102 TaxID=358220 RepID=UPI00028AE545|nr:glycosyltransferase [Acidovorax sp. KKS102]AFU45175.1 glycosyl transferase group 1 protein [Acidovorax sp. KKS102]
MRNAHLNINEFTNASRVLKQVNSLIRARTFETIIIIALGSPSLKKHEIITPGIELYRIQLLTRSLPKNLIFQAIKYIEFFIRATWLLAKFKPQVVNAHALGVLPIACFYKLFSNSRLIYDAHELETEQTGGKSLRKSLSKWLEKRLINCHDLMFAVSESIADWYANEYKIARPSVILNAPHKREIKINNHFREQLGIRNNQTILLYQGGLAPGRGIHLILDAFKARSDDKVVAVFMGYGPLEEHIKKAALQQQNIFFHPAVKPQVVLEYTASADIGINLIENTCLNHEYCMPNKLFEYIMTGLPVLTSNTKDMSYFVSKNQIGTAICDLSATGVNKAIGDFLIRDLTIMKANAYRVACEHAWEVQEKKMLAAYQDMLEANG